MSKVIKHQTDQKVSVTAEPRDYRKELWVGVAIAVARAENTRDSDKPAKWANNALAEFDKAFGEK